MTIIKNCRIVPYLTEGYDLQAADIVVEDKTISDIVPCGKLDGADASYIDLHGKTVLPGFFDLHAHLMYTNSNWE